MSDARKMCKALGEEDDDAKKLHHVNLEKGMEEKNFRRERESGKKGKAHQKSFSSFSVPTQARDFTSLVKISSVDIQFAIETGQPYSSVEVR